MGCVLILLGLWGGEQWRERRAPTPDSVNAREKYLVMRETYHILRDLIRDYEALFSVEYVALRYDFGSDGTVTREDPDRSRVVVRGDSHRGLRTAMQRLERTMVISMDLLDHYEDRYLAEKRSSDKTAFAVGAASFGSADTALIVTDVRRALPTQPQFEWGEAVYERHVEERVVPVIDLARQEQLLIIHAWQGGGRYAMHPRAAPQVGELRVGWRRDHERVHGILRARNIKKLIYVGNSGTGIINGPSFGMQVMESKGYDTYLISDAIIATPPGPATNPLAVTPATRQLLKEATARVLRYQQTNQIGTQLPTQGSLVGDERR
ncbi:MAG: hypothetical protein AAF581_00910 [Planctomycetota bacterium]